MSFKYNQLLRIEAQLGAAAKYHSMNFRKTGIIHSQTIEVCLLCFFSTVGLYYEIINVESAMQHSCIYQRSSWAKAKPNARNGEKGSLKSRLYLFASHLAN
jgi:hypothetical protein